MSTNIVRQSNRFQRNIFSMISGLRGYLLSGENHFIQSYDSSRNENINIGISAYIVKPLKLNNPTPIDSFNLMIDLLSIKNRI